MKRTLIITTIAVTISVCSWAQDNQVATTANDATAYSQQAPAVNPSAELPKQPATVVESTPLKTSKADELRKSREQTEVETEQKIVEKLEQSRIEDEQRRQKQVLGAVGSVEAAPAAQPPVAPVVQPLAPVLAQPAPVAPPQPPAALVQQAPVAPPAPVPTPAVVPDNSVPAQPSLVVAPKDNEVKTEVNNDNKPDENKQQQFAAVSLGMINYNSLDVQSFGAYGVSYGIMYPSNWAIDGHVNYSNSNYSDNTFLFRNINQYNIGADARYMILHGRVRPNVGATVDYVHREYSNLQDPYGNPVPSFSGPINSDALDAGVLAGVDVSVANNFTLGLEYRYMSNITYKFENSNFLNSPLALATMNNLEGRSYDIWAFTIKYMF